MITTLLAYALVSCQEFLVASLESTIICFVLHLVYKAVFPRLTMDDDNSDDPDLSELPDCYALPDTSKTAHIRALENQVRVLGKQLLDARNQLNTLTTELEKYRQVQGQVAWLIERFRVTLSGVASPTAPPALLPPPPPPPLPPLVLDESDHDDVDNDDDWDSVEVLGEGGEEDLDKLLEDVTPRTCIMDIYKKWNPSH